MTPSHTSMVHVVSSPQIAVNMSATNTSPTTTTPTPTPTFYQEAQLTFPIQLETNDPMIDLWKDATHDTMAKIQDPSRCPAGSPPFFFGAPDPADPTKRVPFIITSTAKSTTNVMVMHLEQFENVRDGRCSHRDPITHQWCMWSRPRS